MGVPERTALLPLPAKHDAAGRPPVSPATQDMIISALQELPPFKQAALVGIVDEQGARLMSAVKFGDTWKVAGGAGWSWDGGPKKVDWWVAVQASW